MHHLFCRGVRLSGFALSMDGNPPPTETSPSSPDKLQRMSVKLRSPASSLHMNASSTHQSKYVIPNIPIRAPVQLQFRPKNLKLRLVTKGRFHMSSTPQVCFTESWTATRVGRFTSCPGILDLSAACRFLLQAGQSSQQNLGVTEPLCRPQSTRATQPQVPKSSKGTENGW